MEGTLKLWIEDKQAWVPKHFILHNQVLLFCSQKGGEVQGRVHMQISSVSLFQDNQQKFSVDTGSCLLQLLAGDRNEKINWINALQDSIQTALSDENQTPLLPNNGPKLTEDARQNLQQIDQALAKIWQAQARVEEILNTLIPRLNLEKQHLDSVIELEKQTHFLKVSAAECTQILEQENKNLLAFLEYLTQKIGFADFSDFQSPTKQKVHSISPDKRASRWQGDEQEESKTYYQSFDENEAYVHANDQHKKDKDQSKKALNQNQDLRTLQQQPQLEQIIAHLKTSCPLKYNLLTGNPVYKLIKISNEKTRKQLPHFRDPNEKINFWSILKDAIGKDLTRISLPVYLNEPFSFLQNMAQGMEYHQLLAAANKETNQFMRIAYIAAYAFALCSFTIGRRKNANPLLGETYELIIEEFGIYFIAEQVSHHPPITAYHGESDDFIIYGDSTNKVTFWGKHIEIIPLRLIHITLKKTGEEFTIKRSPMTVNNILIGKLYIDFSGDVEVRNLKTGDSAIITLKERSWFSNSAYQGNGAIKNARGELIYQLEGTWDRQLQAIESHSKKSVVLWQRHQLIDNHERQYFYTNFQLQMNHLTEDMLLKIAPTDARLRPDQRALENGLMDVANAEKNRMEEKQRARRQQYEQMKLTHKPRWFQIRTDPITKADEYIYAGEYFKARSAGTFDNVLDIF